MIPKKCMVIAKSLTDTKHVVLVPLPAFDKAYRPRGCRGYHGQILVDQLTLSQPWGANYARHITNGTLRNIRPSYGPAVYKLFQFGCRILKMVGPKKQDFWPKINIFKGNHCILRIQGAPVCQKLGMILENNVSTEKSGQLNIYS